MQSNILLVFLEKMLLCHLFMPNLEYFFENFSHLLHLRVHRRKFKLYNYEKR